MLQRQQWPRLQHVGTAFTPSTLPRPHSHYSRALSALLAVLVAISLHCSWSCLLASGLVSLELLHQLGLHIGHDEVMAVILHAELTLALG